MDVKLVVVEGLRLGTVITVRGDRFLIGRDPHCQLRPRSAAVSTLHCAIRRHGDNVLVQDLGSTNGTLVNDQCLRRGDSARVKDGDRLQVAQLIFTFRITRDAKSGGPEILDWLAPDETASLIDPMASTQILPGSHPRSMEGDPLAASGLFTPTEILDQFRIARHEPARRLRIAGLSAGQINQPDRMQAARNLLLAWSDDPKNSRLVVDLESIDFIPSSLFALLHSLARRCQQSGGGLRLSGASPEIRKALATLRLDRMIPCFDTPDQAAADWA